MKTSTQKKLIAYSAFASSSVLIAYSQNGIEYIDVDPDTVLNASGEEFEIDMDHNGSIDFNLQNFSFTVNISYSYSFTFSLLVRDLLFRVYDSNSVAGVVQTGSSSGSLFSVIVPYVLYKNELINNNLSWQTDNDEILAFQHFWPGGTQAFDEYGYWLNGVNDGYIGVRFLDDQDLQHYGWVRCYVGDDARTLIIKDYAYETKPETAIRAGAVSSEQAEPFIYYNQGVLHISFTTELVTPVTLQILDMKGAIVYKTVLSDQYFTLYTRLANGSYIVQLLSEEIDQTKKIVVFE